MKTTLLLLLFGLMPFISPVSAAVDITTNSASQVTDLSATLSGTINVHSVGSWLIDFKFGKTEALELGAKTLDQFLVEGAKAGENTLTRSSRRLVLEPSTTYYYRFRAKNTDDLTEVYYGEIRSFTTLPPATAPTAILVDNWSPPPFSHKQGVLRADVFSGSSLTKVIFQYGTSVGDLNTEVPIADLQGVNTTKETRCSVIDLSPSTTYYYRCLVSNAQGSTYSGIKSFLTTAAPTLTTGSATEIKPDSAILNGTVDLNGSLPAAVYFQYGETTDYGGEAGTHSVGGANHFEVKVSRLKPDTTYHFRLKTSQNRQESNQALEYGEDRTFKTKVAGEKPQFDVLPLISELDVHQATVSIQNIFTGTSDATLSLEYGKTDAYGSVVPVLIPLDGFRTYDSYDISIPGLEADTTYHYRVIATNVTGAFISDSATFKTFKEPIVTTGAASNIRGILVDVTGSVTSYGGHHTLHVEWGTTTQYGKSSRLVAHAGSYSATPTLGTIPNTLYHYRFYLYDGLHYHYGEDKTFTTAAPSILPQLSQERMAWVQFSAWESVWQTEREFISADAARMRVVFFSGGSPATLYIDYGKSESLGMTHETNAAGAVGNVEVIKDTILNLDPDTVYYWRARATNSSGSVSSPNIMSFKTLKAPVISPRPAIAVTDTSATLVGGYTPNRWESGLEMVYGPDTSTLLTAQQITPEFVNGLNNETGTPVLDLSTRNVTASVTGLMPNTTYYYRLKAKQLQIFPPPIYQGELLSFTTGPPATPPVIHGEIILASRSETSAQLVLDGFNAGSSPSTVVLEYGPTVSYGSQITHSETFSTNVVASPQFNIQGLTPDTVYHARVSITNGQGSTNSLDFEFTTLPPGDKPSFTGVAGFQNVTISSARLFVESLTTGDAETTLTFEYGLTDAYGSVATQVLPANYSRNYPASNIRGLAPNTQYHFRAIASSEYGSISTDDFVFTTLPLPEVVTSSATAVTDLSAVLHGIAQPHGTYGSVHFDWGETTDYDFKIYPASPYTASTDPVPFSVPLTGLKPNTTYHFRICFNDVLGDDFTFITGEPSSLPTIEGDVLLFGSSSSGAKLRVDKVTAGGGPATISFEYGTSSSYGQEVSLPDLLGLGDSLNFPTVTLDGLAPNTLYHARCKVSNEHGVVYSDEITFSTAFQLNTQPATDVTDIDATFHGLVNAGGGALNAISFVWWDASGSQGSIAASVTSATGMDNVVVTAQPYGLLPATTYQYHLRASDAAGFLSYGPALTFVTAEASSKPIVLGPVVVTASGLTTASVKTSGVRAGGGITTVSFEYGTTTSYGTSVIAGAPLQPSTTGLSSINLNTLQPDTLYHIRIKASNAYGDDYSEDATFETLANPIIKILPIVDVKDLSATLRGTLQANGNPPYQKTFHYGSGGSFNRQKTAYNPVSTDPETGEETFEVPIDHLAPNTQYTVKFKFSNWESDEITFTTAPPMTRPTLSEEISVLQISDTKAKFLTGLILAESSITSVELEYGLTPSYGSKVTLDSISLNQQARQTVILSELLPNTLYHVRVKATNGEGVSYSPDFTFTTYPALVLVMDSVESVTDISAICKATVNTGGRQLNARFECRKVGSSDSSSDSSQMAISGNVASPLTYNAEQVLFANEEYSCRLAVYDGLSYYYSNTITFVTSSPASIPEILADLTIVNIGTKSADFKIDSSNAEMIFAGSSDATLTFEYGSSESYDQSIGYARVATFPAFRKSYVWPVSVAELIPGQTYYVRAKATNAQGTSYSNAVVFNTLSAPLLETQSATDIGEFSALLNGSIDTLEVLTFTSFKWGLTEALEGSITASMIWPSSDYVETSALLKNLQPNTTYYYQVYARYSTDEHGYYGEIKSFTTAPPVSLPAVPNRPNARFIKSNSIQVATQYSSGASPADIVLEYGTTASFGSMVDIAIALPPSQQFVYAYNLVLGGLQPGTTYYMRIKASSALGTAYSPVTTFTTAPLATPRTNEPYNIKMNSVTLSGGVQTGASPDSGGFEWGDDTSYGQTTGAYKSGIQYTYNLYGLLPARTYHYRFFVMENGLKIYGEDMIFLTLPPNVSPVISSEIAAYGITASAATVWVGSVSAPADIIFKYGTTIDLGMQKSYPISETNTFEFQNVELELTDLLPDTTYYYRCVATNVQGSQESEVKSFKTLPTPLFFEKEADDLLGESVTLKADINPQENLLEPVFEYGTTSALGQTAAPMQASIKGNERVGVGVNVSGLKPETTYHFRVIASDSRGEMYVGPESTVTTLSLIEGWRKKYYGTTANIGNAADNSAPFGDGISNLIKYALGMAPQKNLPQMTRIREVQGGNRLTFSFNRNPLKTDLIYTVEASNTLKGVWEVLATSSNGAIATGTGIISESAGIDGGILVDVADTQESTSGGKRFMRLKVTRKILE